MKNAKKATITCIRCGQKCEGLLCSCGYWNVASDTRLLSAVTTLDKVQDEKVDRLDCGRYGFCFGGGIARATTTLIGGEPGIGKSTLFLHLAAALQCKVLYLASEEKLIRIKQRADRLEIPKSRQADISIARLTTGEVPEIGTLVKTHPVLMLDSINMLTEDANSAVAFCKMLVGISERFGTTCLLTSHVTKGGDIAGFEALQHMVDATMMFFPEEITRVLFVQKNRNGMAFTSQRYEMGAKGLTILSEESPGTYEEESEQLSSS